MSATRCSRSSRYANRSDIAAVTDGRPEATVLAMYPSCFSTRRHVLDNAARPRFAMTRAQLARPETGGL
eukprot:6909742-Lingulodinium_polyedra.AAC.1